MGRLHGRTVKTVTGPRNSLFPISPRLQMTVRQNADSRTAASSCTHLHKLALHDWVGILLQPVDPGPQVERLHPETEQIHLRKSVRFPVLRGQP